MSLKSNFKVNSKRILSGLLALSCLCGAFAGGFAVNQVSEPYTVQAVGTDTDYVDGIESWTMPLDNKLTSGGVLYYTATSYKDGSVHIKCALKQAVTLKFKPTDVMSLGDIACDPAFFSGDYERIEWKTPEHFEFQTIATQSRGTHLDNLRSGLETDYDFLLSPDATYVDLLKDYRNEESEEDEEGHRYKLHPDAEFVPLTIMPGLLFEIALRPNDSIMESQRNETSSVYMFTKTMSVKSDYTTHNYDNALDDNGYHRFTFDVNGDGAVTTADLMALKLLLLGAIDSEGFPVDKYGNRTSDEQWGYHTKG